MPDTGRLPSVLRFFCVAFGALILYFICLDRGASLWDCPEYVLIAWRLEIGHPPGNPTWQLMANVVSRLGGSAEHAALLINATSAVAMALASAILSNVIFIFLRATILRGPGRALTLWANLCAAAAALCFAWCDSAIFSAVEAEVYALSALLTILMLWLMLLWANARSRGQTARSRRLLILIAYLTGLGAGVHELNFLILPALLLIYIYGARRYPAASSGLPTLLWSVLMLLIGATTYLLIPIRAAANPPINTGNPSTLKAFADYYRRTQYGSSPLLYGRTPYSVPLRRETYDSRTDTYSYNTYFLNEHPDGRKEYVYADELNMWLPRMTSSNPDDIEFYESWGGMRKEDMVAVKAPFAIDSAGYPVGRFNPATGERELVDTYRPTYLQQLRYFAGYQAGYMYFRYLLWNFAGRQNNVASTGAAETGNFITGIPAADDALLGPQSRLPASMREDNVGYNRYFLIPLIFGIIGIVALCRAGRTGRRLSAVNAIFFLFTGLLIVVYLNQNPGEPRERDYSFLGSYMAWTVWIGCGLGTMVRLLLKLRLSRRWSALVVRVAAALICIGVPLQMLSQTYDDHDRRHTTGAEEVARKILTPLEPDAIIFVRGDNVIFPLWYAQEVLGLRRDVSVVAIPYLAVEWYREQLRRPGEEALPVDLSVEAPAGSGSITDRVMADIKHRNAGRRPIYERDSVGVFSVVGGH